MERPGSSQKSFEAYAMFDGTPGTTFRILGNTRADKSDIFAVDTSFEMGMISTRSSNSNSKYNVLDPHPSMVLHIRKAFTTTT